MAVSYTHLDVYKRQEYSVPPETFFEGVYALMPAHYLWFKDGRVETHRYWEPKFEPDEAMTEEEAIEEIMEAISRKNDGINKKIIVTGCLAERYQKQMDEEFPEIDAVVGIAKNDDIVEIINSVMLDKSCLLYTSHYGGLIDVALLDIMMPGMDGSELCRWLRQKSDTMGIIMLSAKSQEVDKIRCLTQGADDYVTKPFSPSELVARVDAVYLSLIHI